MIFLHITKMKKQFNLHIYLKFKIQREIPKLISLKNLRDIFTYLMKRSNKIYSNSPKKRRTRRTN